MSAQQDVKLKNSSATPLLWVMYNRIQRSFFHFLRNAIKIIFEIKAGGVVEIRNAVYVELAAASQSGDLCFIVGLGT